MGPSFKIITLCMLCLVLLVLIIVLALVWSMPDLPPTVSNNKICLPAEKGRLVCNDTPQRLHGYLNRIITVSYDQVRKKEEEQQQRFLKENQGHLMAIYDRYFWEMKPSAKVTGKEQPVNTKNKKVEEMTPIRVWRHGRELFDTSGFLRYGVRYRNGRLVVPVSGTYFIYSYVDLFEEFNDIPGKPNIKNATKPIKHALYKFNILDEAETEIVTNIQPHVVSRNRYYNSYSSFVSSLVSLKAGDEISVKISDISYIRYTRNNYFGLNLI
ncbi:tumor necrosis factor ligand superfamily member 15-like [Ruditapes philippinarum]|uniref:tumor necrosis factor ligand superfamily member 15-like n=1 Tax=Ruditapes philippinarum TaxID=129788 RepID=UPI00295AB5CF|nr:tumor necrosis factor ligand superfamily member 15-like [Ruditapes philippinarum]